MTNLHTAIKSKHMALSLLKVMMYLMRQGFTFSEGKIIFEVAVMIMDTIEKEDPHHMADTEHLEKVLADKAQAFVLAKLEASEVASDS